MSALAAQQKLRAIHLYRYAVNDRSLPSHGAASEMTGTGIAQAFAQDVPQLGGEQGFLVHRGEEATTPCSSSTSWSCDMGDFGTCELWGASLNDFRGTGAFPSRPQHQN